MSIIMINCIISLIIKPLKKPLKNPVTDCPKLISQSCLNRLNLYRSK